jgi:hypothetical protein
VAEISKARLRSLSHAHIWWVVGQTADGSLELVGRSSACANISVSPNSIKFVAPLNPTDPQSSSQPNPSSVLSSHYHQNVDSKFIAIDTDNNCGMFHSIQLFAIAYLVIREMPCHRSHGPRH